MGKNYTTREIADMLHLYTEGVSRLIREGKLKAHKENGKWTVNERDLEKFLEDHAGYRSVYAIHKKRTELTNLKENDPKEYYKYKMKQALKEIENMRITLDRYYKGLQRILNEEEL